jgi:hypothetical protein
MTAQEQDQHTLAFGHADNTIAQMQQTYVLLPAGDLTACFCQIQERHGKPPGEIKKDAERTWVFQHPWGC